MPLTGGLRDRMLQESVREQITAHLQSLGWLDANREHTPLTFVNGFPDDQDEVQVNTVAFSVEQAAGSDYELGSLSEEHRTLFFIDMFMENDSVGWHLSGDIYFYLKKNRALSVYDYESGPPPVVDFTVDIEGVDRRKPTRATQAWQKYWHTISFEALDTRANA
jgi:hypothetical protein